MRTLYKGYFKALAGGMAVLGISLIFLFFNCSKNLPTAPQNRLAAFSPAKLDPSAAVPISPVMVAFGTAGGEVKFPVGSDTALFSVPAGALDSVVQLTFSTRIVPTVDGKVLFGLYDFAPNGVKFNKSCKLSLPARFADGTVVPFYWLNPKTGFWELQESCYAKSKKVHFKIDHFSTYSAPVDGLGSGGQQ